MDITLLRTFLAVYRAGSLTAAAPRLGLSQPTVTAQLRALETALGQPLFIRSARGVTPTLVADELAHEVAPHVDALNAVAERGTAPAHPDQGRAEPVRIGGPAELTGAWLVPTLSPLVAQGLRFRFVPGLPEDLFAGLVAGRFDLVVSTVRPRLKAIAATPFLDEELVLAAAPAWAERIDPQRLTADPTGELHGVPLVAYAEELPVIRRYWRSLFGRRPVGEPAVTVPDLRAVLAALVAGAGISVLPRYLCQRELADGSLVALLDPEVAPINTLYLAELADGTARPPVVEVRNLLLAAARVS